MRLIEAPLDATDAAITVTGDLVEVGLWQIETTLVAARAGVNDFSLVRVAIRAGDGDKGTAEGVTVGIATIVDAHDLVRDSDHLLVLCARNTAGAHADCVVG